jgi:hypothetical protein
MTREVRIECVESKHNVRHSSVTIWRKQSRHNPAVRDYLNQQTMDIHKRPCLHLRTIGQATKRTN